jgi:flavin reductase (DIM6/NTAB) family NADH-FMN oxidoreductase RutF
VSRDPLWAEDGASPSPYPGWMAEDQGLAYQHEVAGRFLTAMGALAATVCVVAASSPSGQRSGITATAVCSLSSDPPRLVVCVNRGSSMARALGDTGWFSLNVLAAGQQSVAEAFAGRTGLTGDARFDDAQWTRHVTGTPVLTEAAATCVCHVSSSMQQATHLIVVGAVLDVLLPDGDLPPPLIYHRRRFTTIEAGA